MAANIAIDERAPPETAEQPTSASPAARVSESTPANDTPASVHSTLRSAASSAVRDMKCEVLAHWLYAKAEARLWTHDEPGEGVFVKKSKGNYAHYPPDLTDDKTGIGHAIAALNVPVSRALLLDFQNC